jgi:23S rRNA (uridine2552-2'-O)-methyltransferase
VKLEQAKRDYYRRLAKEKGYRSRSAFKLQQMNNKYHLIRRGSKVVDIGAAPGGWLQIASELVGVVGLVVGLDLDPIKDVSKNTRVIQGDITDQYALDKILGELAGDRADCVMADLSPKLSGIWDIDHFKQIDLCMKVMDLMPAILKRGGSSVMKAFHGDELRNLTSRMRKSFERVEISKPNASRKESSEVYIVGIGFSGQTPRQPIGESEPEQQYEGHSDSVVSDW